jgi:hypothetical protein
VSDVAAALLTAVDRTCDQFFAIAEGVADPAEIREMSEAERKAGEQFVHAFAELLREALRGERAQRDLVMETAVPALVANGQTPLELLRGHVSFYMALQPHLLDAVPADLRLEAGRWLARYAADYTHEVVARATEAQAG